MNKLTTANSSSENTTGSQAVRRQWFLLTSDDINTWIMWSVFISAFYNKASCCIHEQIVQWITEASRTADTFWAKATVFIIQIQPTKMKSTFFLCLIFVLVACSFCSPAKKVSQLWTEASINYSEFYHYCWFIVTDEARTHSQINFYFMLLIKIPFPPRCNILLPYQTDNVKPAFCGNLST